MAEVKGQFMVDVRFEQGTSCEWKPWFSFLSLCITIKAIEENIGIARNREREIMRRRGYRGRGEEDTEESDVLPNTNP